MEIREAIEDDIPKIVELLKLSLGESLLPKSEAYWRWKHLDNPFGPSPVIVAEEGKRLVGVRAFMRWQWQKSGDVIEAVRAVDTATHPEYQGRGIFKKLTLNLLETCAEQSVQLVFNTPNDQSKPGYLKMGWNEIGRLPVLLNIKRPFNILKHRYFSDESPLEGNIEVDKDLQIQKITDQTIFNVAVSGHNDKWSTPISDNYLKWRYGAVPILDYFLAKYANSALIYRVKVERNGPELRILNYFGNHQDLIELINRLGKVIGPGFISSDGLGNLKLPGLLTFKRNVGPIVTVRKIVNLETFKFNFDNWSPTLGDLELF